MQVGLLIDPMSRRSAQRVNVTAASEVQQADGEMIYASFEPRDAAAYRRHRR